MTTPRQVEGSANYALGDVLTSMLPGCQVRAENTQLFTQHPGRHADVLITAAGRSPVVVEAEYMPAGTAETDAKSRLGLLVMDEPRPVEAAIAVRYPIGVRTADNLSDTLVSAEFSYCVHYEDGSRFPQSGWLSGSVTDLADLIRLVSVPQRAVDESSRALEKAIDTSVAIINEMAEIRPHITPAIARLLGLDDVLQTRRMACAIIANAIAFQGRLHGIHQSIKSLRQTAGEGIANPQRETIAAWDHILNINYWPIFAVARDIVEQLPSSSASQILRRLMLTAESINASGAHISHDLTGRVFQRLIADRKYLATFYTLPASAALLARLAVAKISPSPQPAGRSLTPSPLAGEGWGEGDITFDWSDPAAIGKLRIADFACGTGALLSGVYEQIANRHERAGGDSAQLHPVMMEQVLYGCDVLPSAIHITGSTLAGAQPSIGYGSSHIYTMPYGRQPDGTAAIGSLELLNKNSQLVLLNTNDPARRTGSVGEETAAHMMVDFPDEGFDLVIMNPPFTRATNHEGAHSDVTNPAFAAFDASRADQTAMGNRINRFGKDTCYHGNAGVASAFAALAHQKLKPGGVLALVLPLSAAAGLSWQAFRQLLAAQYTGLEVLSIAANGREMSFSSDTGMAECLVIACKRNPQRNPPVPTNPARPEPAEGLASRARFTSLRRRPQGFAQAAEISKNITANASPRTIEDGPYGGTILPSGDEITGEILTAPQTDSSENWGSVRLADYYLAQTAYALTQSQLWLPARHATFDLPIAPLGIVGKLGLVDRDVTGPPPRGPFDRLAANPSATYPALWNHNAKNETRLVCEADSELRMREGMDPKAANVWATSSRSHLSRGFRFNSQPLAVAFTDRVSIGGRAWPNVIFDDDRIDYAFAIWDNCTLGLLLYWWHSNVQVAGRGDITIRMAESLPVLDFRTLSDEQLATAQDIFDDFRERDLMPAYLADADPNRVLLDRRVICDLLGFDDATYRGVRRLAQKWCAEPSVHGGKARPKDATYVE